MRTHAVRRRRRVPWGNVTAGIVALITLGVLALSPLFASTAISAFRSHEAAVGAAAANHVNQDVHDADLDFVVHRAQCGYPTLRGENGQLIQPANGQFCVVEVTIHNNGTDPVALAPGVQLATGSRGAVYPTEASADNLVNGGNPAVIPGGSWDSRLVYDVPTGITLVGIDLHGSEYSRGVAVRL